MVSDVLSSSYFSGFDWANKQCSAMQNSFIIYKCKTFDTFIQISLKFNCEGHQAISYLFIGIIFVLDSADYRNFEEARVGKKVIVTIAVGDSMFRAAPDSELPRQGERHPPPHHGQQAGPADGPQ